MTTVPTTPDGDNNIQDIINGEKQKCAYLQTQVFLLLGYNVIMIIIYITEPVTIILSGDNNVVDTIGERQIYTCTINSSCRPAWIQWYIYYYFYYSTSDNSVNHSIR